MSIEALILSGGSIHHFFTSDGFDDVSRERILTHITASVMRWYTELETGCVRTASGESIFVPGLVEYRADVSNALRSLPEHDRKILLLVHRDGLTHRDAVSCAGVKTLRPDSYVRQLETNVGRIFERRKLNDLQDYILG